jgi:two-component system CheB/CheR fusion protein
VKRNGDYHPVIVTIRPVQGPRGADGLLLVTFQDSALSLPLPRPAENRAEDAVVRQLEYELKATREDLQSTIEELESSYEELQVSNEEVMSMNEELQSANEELETSKEELQSLNEELNTVNSQLQDRVAELESANNDLANLLNCTDLAIIFLDNHFRIKRFTAPTTRLFNVIATDVGRPISDIAAQFRDQTLHQDIAGVFRTSTPQEKQVQTPDGRWWNRRITPYRTLDNRIEGVVLTFTDVTQVKQADEQARRLATVLLDSNDAVCVHDFEGKITAWNRGAEKMTGYSEAAALQLNVEQMIPEELRASLRSDWEKLRRGERIDSWETQRTTKDGRILDVWVTATALKDEMGRPVAIATTERDITEQKRAHARLEYEIEQRATSQEQLAAVLHTAADAIITSNAQGTIQSVNKATERMFGYTAAEMIGRNVKILMPSPHRQQQYRYLANYAKTGVKAIIGVGREVMARRKDGSTFPVDLAVSEVDHLKLFTGILRDITRRKELEREVVEIASLEQRRIGQDLHDSVSQELTALNILAGDLAESLRTNPLSASKLVEQIVQGLQRSQRELRTVIRGLLPVAVDTEGLMAALSDLADRIQQEGKATCTFDCPEPVTVADNLNATHLYLIAQEAVRNAIKHARPRNIRISLESDDLLVLRVQDDGTGMPAGPTENHGGLGLRIMRNRAAIIGAALTIQPAEPTGTLMTCALARRNRETEPDQETSPDLDRR